MSDSLPPNWRRSKTTMTRNINNNIKIIPKSRRRNRGSRTKNVDVHPKAHVEMTAKEAERDRDRDKERDRERDETPDPPEAGVDRAPRAKPERQYSRVELIQLMTHPLSSIKHPCLESPQNKSLVSGRTTVRWLEGRWEHRKHTDSLTDEDRPDQPTDSQKKKINDPKAERLRKEQDVVLSPQRRSFNSGCFVNLPPQHSAPATRRPESPLKGEREQSHRELPVRRIGSGRIVRDPVWDFRTGDKEEVTGQTVSNHDYNFRQRDDRFERRTFERSHDKERGQQRTRYDRHSNNDRRKYERNEPEEPEWFSGGPTSQHDTIELHGFDGPVEEKISPNKKQNKNNKNSVKNSRKVSETIQSKSEAVPSGKRTPSLKSSPKLSEKSRLSPSPGENKQFDFAESKSKTSDANPDSVFSVNIEDILDFSLPPLLADESSGSRFSQFFRRESPSPEIRGQEDSSHSSAHDKMFNSMINDITSTNIAIPPDGDTYFAPISPAASSIKQEESKGSSLLEMLQRDYGQGFPGRKITKKPSLRDLEACGKIHNVEELEARLRQEQGLGKPVDYNQPRNKEEELQAFRKLIMNKQHQNMQEHKSPHSNVSSGGGGGFQQQQQSQQQPQQLSVKQQQQPQQQQQMPIPHDLVMKLLHVQQQQRQQEVFAKLLAPPSRLAGGQYSVPPPVAPLSPELQMYINNSQPSKELLQRPEAQTIIRSLKRGEITILHLVEQLKRNSSMQPVHREMIASIIKLHGLQSVLQRVPSPRELVAHTQNILQNALLKKKLEEQKENFRKRQEMQRSHSPNISAAGSLSPANQQQQPNTTSPTPLAFTPTSVLRKMTADKEPDLTTKQPQPDTSMQPTKQGRAIVKGGNNNFSVPPPVDYSNMPPQYKGQGQRTNPQHLMGMMNMNRNNPPNPRVRNMGSSNMMNLQQQGMNQSVQQLLMNPNYNSPHQRNNSLLKPDQRSMRSGRNFNYNCADSQDQVNNQLARWFSPELLAQAREGKLPHMPPLSPTQHMLSVEELERLQQVVHN